MKARFGMNGVMRISCSKCGHCIRGNFHTGLKNKKAKILCKKCKKKLKKE